MPCGAVRGRAAVATSDLVIENEQQEVLERHILLVGKYQTLDERLDESTEA